MTTAMKTWSRPETKAQMPTDGPWQSEPDKAVWVDEATGLDCMIHRGPLGSLCGYVGVGPDHPWHGLGYSSCTRSCGEDWCDHTPDSLISVHGGLTYAASCQESASEDEGICHVPAPGRPHDVFWYGFDCAHSGDFVPGMDGRRRSRLGSGDDYRDFEYVAREVAGLAKQLANLSRAHS